MVLSKLLLVAKALVELCKAVAFRTAVVLEVIDHTVEFVNTGDASHGQLENECDTNVR